MDLGSDNTNDITVEGFAQINAHAYPGIDRAILTDSSGDDIVTTALDEVNMYCYYGSESQVNVTLSNFDEVSVDCTHGGHDLGGIYDSSGNDTLTSALGEVTMDYGSNSHLVTLGGFDLVLAQCMLGGTDQAIIAGSSGDDRFNALVDAGVMECEMDYGADLDTDLIVRGFDEVFTNLGNGGNDICMLTDSTGDDDLELGDTWVDLDWLDGLFKLHLTGLGAGDFVGTEKDGDDDWTLVGTPLYYYDVDWE